MARTKEAAPIVRYRRIVGALRACQRAKQAAEAAAELRLAVVHTALESGHRATDIAPVLGVSRQTVYRIARRGSHLDVPLFADLDDVAAANRDLDTARRRLLSASVEARLAGATFADIGEVLGLTAMTVRQQIIDHGADYFAVS